MPARAWTRPAIGSKLPNFAYVSAAIEACAGVVAIVATADKTIDGVNVYQYDGNIRSDLGLPTETTFIADKSNHVVAYLLPISRNGTCRAIVAAF